jgi:hypothetical protein
MSSFNTIGYHVANDYLQSSFMLDQERFRNLLSENVEMQHITDGQEYKEIGRDQVMAIYKEKFFDSTNNFDIQKVTIRSNNLQPEFTCKVSENKKEGNNEYRAEFKDHTVLHLINEKGEWKVKNIITQVSKKIL